MPFELFDHVSATGKNEFRSWAEDLQKPQRAKLDARLDWLGKEGLGLLPEILTGTDTPGIMKLRIKGNVQLRPMLCRGPVKPDSEFTLLLGATEVGGELRPKNADQKAGELRDEVAASPGERRTKHERVR